MAWPPSQGRLHELLASRHTPEVQRAIARGRVLVAGLGGLGSHVAMALARCGVGHLKLVDFDTVDESNLQRQQYFPRHLGRLKTEALRGMIAELNPYIAVETENARLTADNAPAILAGWPVIVEALDRAEAKAEVVAAALAACPGAQVICGSGLAGLGDANTITTRRAAARLYVCGDGVSATGPGVSLMAPRVMVCAGHQANLAIQLLLKGNDDDGRHV